jgi:hypothetical protein
LLGVALVAMHVAVSQRCTCSRDQRVALTVKPGDLGGADHGWQRKQISSQAMWFAKKRAALLVMSTRGVVATGLDGVWCSLPGGRPPSEPDPCHPPSHLHDAPKLSRWREPCPPYPSQQRHTSYQPTATYLAATATTPSSLIPAARSPPAAVVVYSLPELNISQAIATSVCTRE